jgi:hypothetical protein
MRVTVTKNGESTGYFELPESEKVKVLKEINGYMEDTK